MLFSRTPWLVIPLGVALALGGCGSDNEGGDLASKPGTTPVANTAGEDTVTVEIRSIKFAPKNLLVQPGTTVRWINGDELLHTVTKTSGPGEGFNSGNVAPGESYELTFTESGRVDYVCTLHHGQVGSVVVAGG